MKKLIFLVLIAAIALMCFSCKAKNSEPSELNKYVMEITIDEDLEVQQSLQFTNIMSENLEEIKFNLYANAYREAAENKAYKDNLIKYGGIDISLVSIGDNEANYSINDDMNILTVKTTPLELNESIIINMDYTVTIPSSNLRLGKYNDTINIGNFYPVLAVYEDNGWREDAFSRVGDPFFSEVADYEVTINSKKELQIASTGDIVSNNLDGNNRILKVEASKVRDFAMVASEKFKVISKPAGSTTVSYYYIVDENAQATLQTAVDSLTLFSEAFGKYPYKNYRVVETAFLHGGMEYPTLVFINSTTNDREGVVVHETAHQWWYGMVGNDNINESYIDEGLATFSASYYYLLKGEEDKFNLEQSQINSNYQNFIKLKKLNTPDYVPKMNLPLNEYTSNEYNRICYEKSSLMFKNVYDMVGKKKFEKSLKLFVQDNYYGIAKKDDLYRAFNRGCGTDVSKIFDAWIDGSMQTFSFS